MPSLRSLTAGVAAVAVLAAATPAAAAVDDTYVAGADGGALTLRLAGFDVLEVAGSAAAVTPGEATAAATPLAIAGNAIGGLNAVSQGALDESADCLAAVPSPIDALLGAGVACGSVAADGSVPAASATAGALELAVLDLSGAELGALGDLLGSLGVAELLDGLLDPLSDLVLDPLVETLREECGSALGLLTSVPVVGDLLAPLLDALLGAAPDELGALLGLIDDLLGTLLPPVCGVLADVLDLVAGGLDLGAITEGDLLAGLAGAGGIVNVSLLETAADVARDGDVVTAAAGPTDAGAIEVTVSIPLLEDVLGELLVGALTPLLDALAPVLDPLGGALEPLPVLGPIVSDLLDTSALAGLLDGPLLAVGVAPGAATVEADLAAEELTGQATPALVSLDGTLLSLPVLSGLDDALNDLAGVLDSALLSQLRATPLADLVDVSLLDGDVVEEDVDGLSGMRATSGTARVALLAVLGDPLLELELAPTSAAVAAGPETGDTGSPDDPSDPSDPGDGTPVVPSGPDPSAVPAAPGTLPVTGGGLAALLGLGAIAAAAALRRRSVDA